MLRAADAMLRICAFRFRRRDAVSVSVCVRYLIGNERGEDLPKLCSFGRVRYGGEETLGGLGGRGCFLSIALRVVRWAVEVGVFRSK